MSNHTFTNIASGSRSNASPQKRPTARMHAARLRQSRQPRAPGSSRDTTDVPSKVGKIHSCDLFSWLTHNFNCTLTSSSLRKRCRMLGATVLPTTIGDASWRILITKKSIWLEECAPMTICVTPLLIFIAATSKRWDGSTWRWVINMVAHYIGYTPLIIL